MVPAMLFTGLVQSSCFGEFALTRKVYEINSGIGGDDMEGKILRTLFMYAAFIIPVYEACAFIDVVVFNLLEFWTGSNPLALQEGETEQQRVRLEGKEYILTASRNKIRFEEISNGTAVELATMEFREEDRSWNLLAEGKSTKLVSFLGMDKNKAGVFDFHTADGCTETVLVPGNASVAPLWATHLRATSNDTLVRATSSEVGKVL